MSVTREALLQAVRAAPADELAPRQVFADWFTQQGDARGGFINDQCRLTERGLDPVTRRRLRARVRETLAAHASTWTQTVRAMDTRSTRAQVEFRRGFIHALTGDAGQVLAHWRPLLALEPVVHVKLLDASASSMIALARSGLIEHIRQLTVRGTIGDDGARALAEAPDLAHLERLDIYDTDIGDDGLEHLLATEGLSLERLTLTANPITDKGIRALAACPATTALRCLYLSRTSIGDPGVRALADAPQLRHLHTLTLGNLALLTDDGVDALAGSSHLASLRYVEVDRCDEVSYEAVDALKAKVARVRSDWS